MSNARLNQKLINARRKKHWSQEDVAGMLEVAPSTMRRWETEGKRPQPYHRKNLCDLFGMSEEELGISESDHENRECAMHAVQEELVVLDIEQDKTTTEEPTVQQSALPTLEEPEMSNGRSQEAREPVNNQQPAVEAVTPEAPSQQEPVTDNQKRMTRNGTPLFGRDKDITSICARLADPTTRILVVWGMYGVGTTEVAWQVGQEMSDKFVVKFVSLEKVDKPRLVLSKIAEALGTPTVRASSAVGAVVAWLNNLAQQRKEKSTPSTLVVLDPFEQVIDAYSDLLQLLGECPQLKLLVVSRTWQGKLGSIPPDHLYKMALLSCPNRADLVRLRQVELATLPKQLLNDYAAVALFVERAQKYHPTFAVTSENSMAIAEICCTLSGNPLSLTLAAEHMEDQTAEGLLKELFEDVLLIKAKGTYGWGESRKRLSLPLIEVINCFLSKSNSCFVSCLCFGETFLWKRQKRYAW